MKAGNQIDHECWAGRAAGSALHALSGAEEDEFARHAVQCARCAEAADAYAAVLSQLAEVAPTGAPSRALGDRILAAARVEPRQARPAASRSPLGASWSRRVLASAAAAVILAAGGTWAAIAAGSSPARPPLAACAEVGGCQRIELTASNGRAVVATVIVSAGQAWVVPQGLPANVSGRTSYVLWQITRARVPLAVGSFAVSSAGHEPIRIGHLRTAGAATAAFAVSLERGRVIPARPSRTVAAGSGTRPGA